MALVDSIPDDSFAALEHVPDANTRRIYDRGVYSNDTPFTTAPVCQSIQGFPARVGAASTTIYAKPYDGVMVTSTDKTVKGAWYMDVIVSDDPDLSPNEVYVTLTHPAWENAETRKVPFGTGKICCTDLQVVDPPPEVSHVFLGGIAGLNGVEGLWLGTQSQYDAIVTKNPKVVYVVTQ